MLGIVFLLFSFLVGLEVMLMGREVVKKSLGVRGFSGKKVDFPKWMVMFPGGFLIGVLLSGWVVYLLSLGFSYFATEPLRWGNWGGLVLALLFLGWRCVYGGNCRNKKFGLRRGDYKLILGVMLPVLLVFSFLFYYTFRVRGNEMLVGVSVFSDFGPHISMIRSFSRGDNLPTIYPHFPESDIRYHFMFDFVAGNIEYLGLRIDHAFNILSLLSVLSFAMLLFCFASLLSGRMVVGFLTLLLWFLRSSPAFFYFVYENREGFLRKFLGLRSFVGNTLHEDWGLWNQNVYLNQRHLVFGWGILLLVLILLLPVFMEKKMSWFRRLWKTGGVSYMRVFLVGLILGGLGFFNGAVLISALLLLGGLLLISAEKKEYVYAVMLAVGLLWLQKKLFIAGEMVAPQFLFGFLVEEKNFGGVMSYWLELLGVLVFLIPASLVVVGRRYWGLVFVFLLPFIFANTVSLTPDIAVNHKYVMLSVVLLNIFGAYFLVRVWETNRLGKWVSALLLLLLTVTGGLDLMAIINLNKLPMSYEQAGSYWEFVSSTKKDAIFMTDDMPVLNTVLLGGRKVYFGWPYYAWSAGYDTNGRESEMIRIYTAEDGAVFRRELFESGVDYIVYRFEEKKNLDIALRVLEKVYEDEERVIFEVR